MERKSLTATLLFKNLYMSSHSENRFANIDLMETIAIIMMLTYHCYLYSADFINNTGAIYYIRYFFNAFLSPCVCIFFFANGYLLFSKDFNLKKHIFKTIRLAIITLIWALLKIFLLMPIKNEYLSLSEIPEALWNWKNGWINSLWFLTALVCIYIFFPLLKNAFDNNKNIFKYFFVILGVLTIGNTFLNHMLTVLLNVLLHKSTAIVGVNLFNNFNPFRGMLGYTMFYFMLGGILYDSKDRIISISPKKRNILAILVMLISSTCLFLLGLCYSHATNSIFDIVWYGYDSVCTCLNVICIYTLTISYNKDLKLITLISSSTMGVYLIHEFILHSTRPYIYEYPALCCFTFDFIYAIILLAVCVFITYIIKKIPIVRKLV